MIKTEDELCMAKVIVPTGTNNLENVVASSSIIEKHNFMSMIPHQAFSSVSTEGQNKKGK